MERRASQGGLERLLGSRKNDVTPIAVNRTLVRPASTSKIMRRRHTMDEGVRPYAYSGKFFTQAPFPGRRTLDAEEADKGSSIKRLDLQMEQSVFSKRSDGLDTDALACRLALKHRLMLSEVKHIIREFLKAKHNGSGGIDREDFDKAMARIFDVPKVNERVAAGAYRDIGAESQIDMDKFLDWYVANMFTQVNTLNASPEKSASDSLIYRLAQKHDVDVLVIDKIKVKFDSYDLNRSGHIDFKEFQDMFCSILKPEKAEDLSEARLNRFWSQVAKASPKGIDFSEFTEWYLKYFGADADDMLGPLQAFYDSFDPTFQRRNSLKALMRVASLPGTL